MKTGIVFCIAIFALSAVAQETPPITAATSLRALVAEAKQKSPQWIAAQRSVTTAEQRPKQAGAFPGTDLMIQSFSVGDPRPGAGFRSSDFAYVGFGASQELPFAGKRRLRAQVAEKDAAIARAESTTVLADMLDRLKVAYFQLAASQRTLELLDRNRITAHDIEEAAEIRYRVGAGTQQDVLRSQLEQTKLLNEISMQRRESAQLQAQVKALLDREPGSPDIITEPLAPRPSQDFAARLSNLTERNPELQVGKHEIGKTEVEIRSSEREKKPDFGLQYMWQHTSSNFRDYYMATFSIRLPNRGRVNAATAEAQARRAQAEAEQAARQRQLEGELHEQMAIVQNTEQQLKIYGDGLLPQSEAAYRAGIASYRTGRQEFQGLLAAYSDTLRLAIEYQQTLAQHEIALAHIEKLLGEDLP